MCYFNLIGVCLGNKDIETTILQAWSQTCGELQEYINRVMQVAGIKVWVKYVMLYSLQMDSNFDGRIIVTKTYKNVTKLFRGMAGFRTVSRIDLWRGIYSQNIAEFFGSRP